MGSCYLRASDVLPSDVLPSNALAGGILGMGKILTEKEQQMEELARAFS